MDTFYAVLIKMKKFKISYESQIAICLKEIIQTPPDKSFLLLWNKHFRTEIYRNIQTFAFQVLQESSSWASRNGAEQMFFPTPTGDMALAVL